MRQPVYFTDLLGPDVLQAFVRTAKIEFVHWESALFDLEEDCLVSAANQSWAEYVFRYTDESAAENEIVHLLRGLDAQAVGPGEAQASGSGISPNDLAQPLTFATMTNEQLCRFPVSEFVRVRFQQVVPAEQLSLFSIWCEIFSSA